MIGVVCTTDDQKGLMGGERESIYPAFLDPYSVKGKMAKKEVEAWERT